MVNSEADEVRQSRLHDPVFQESKKEVSSSQGIYAELNNMKLFASRLKDALSERDMRVVDLQAELETCTLQLDSRSSLPQARSNEGAPGGSAGGDNLVGSDNLANSRREELLVEIGKHFKNIQNEIMQMEKEKEKLMFTSTHIANRLEEMDISLHRLRGNVVPAMIAFKMLR
mmetsp:Transcript_37976/g.52732  ORF Transcript_37976/g.52732 Transcript_37976/m.52732 type:complete len:172 (+) Transcript_37976:24-539(+)